MPPPMVSAIGLIQLTTMQSVNDAQAEAGD